jgi:transcriptional regulator with XRE-family HTH domain
VPGRPKKTVVSRKDLGERIRTLRRQRDLTQGELAAALGVTQSNVSAIERGARGITIHQVVQLATILRAATDEILGRKPIAEEDALIRDRRFRRRLQRIDQLPKRDQQALLRTIDAFLSKAS